MNVHKIWLLLLFLLIPTILFAQKTRTVKGLVCTTSETKKGEEPLPYASLVILEGKDSTFVKGVASDADGRFNLQFTPQKGTQYLLKASYTGMQSSANWTATLQQSTWAAFYWKKVSNWAK